ncbi:MAG: cadherin-like domain-containing protein, partial [Planctomycetes bacterium]|nr:cadherin-like domain-containing protein [Planctomycetota bacterium]
MESLEPRLLLSGSDLWVSATVAPGSAVLSSPITLSWTVQNRGDEPTASGWGWTDRVYLSQDDQVDINHHGGGDAVVAEFQYEGEPLAAGASYTVPDQAVTLPGGFSGTAWLLFVSDAWDFEVEGDEANNVRAVEINVTAPNVDLRITSATVPASAAASGQIDLSWTVRNTGTAAAAAQWTDTVYLSEDEVLDPWGDYWLGDVLRETPLAGGAQYTATQSIALPNMTPGAYYVIIAADAGFANAQAETDEDNNLRVAPITLVASSVDLRISAEAPAPATQGEQLTLEWTVTNAGSAPAAASWTDSVYVSTDDVLDTNDDYYFGSAWRESGAPLAAGAGYTGAATGFLPSDLSGDLYLLFTTDTWDNQAESNNDNNVFAVPYHVNPVSIDLAVTAVTAAPNARPGEWITIGWDVANLGDVAAESDWSDYVYLSTDTTVDDGDVALGQFNMAWQSPLASGASYSQSNWFTIPAETAAGDYYVLVHTDGGGYSWQMESDEANNVLAAPLRVGTPDLQVTAGTVPPSGDSSNPIEVSWTATNTGDGLAAGFWYDYIYLSDDDVLDGGDVQLGFFRIEEPSPVGVGGSYTRTETVNIPLGASGSRILVAADQAGHLTETDETNNTWAAPITLGSPNLIVADADAPDAAVVGQTISVTYTVRNDGTAPATVGYSDRFYLSADDQWDAGDALLGTAEPWDYLPVAAGGGSYSMAVELPILAGASGGHYLLVVADGSGSVAESDETDNVRALALSLTAPDLTITASGPASAGWGDAVSLSWTVTNAGDGPAAAEWYDRVFLSDDTVLDGDDVAIHSRWAADASPLAAGASYEVTDTVTLPAGRSGTQYLLFVADAYGQQGEADESNNAAVVQISLDGADLAISDTDAAVATASWGETVGLWWTVANIGNRPATSSWYDYVYLSDDGVLDDGDLYVTRFANGGPSPLAIGDSYTSSVSVTIPAGRLGQQYLLVAANGATWSMERQAETDPDNNVQAVPVVLRAANLTISQPEAPAQTGWGQSVTLGWTVTNTGDGTAVASWRDIAYLSADDQLDGSDTFLGNAWADDASPLAAGDAYTVTRTFTVPAGFRGTGYVLIRADGGSDQLESDEQDNLAAVAITVSAPDVTVSAAEAVEAAVWGEMISATWTVTNVGDGAAASPWYDYIVLSADAVLDDSDPTAGAAWAGPYVPLAAGASYTIGRDFTIPTSFQGDGYILFVADGNRSLGESDETNNVTAVPIRLSAPDLELAGLSAPDAVVFGGAFDVSWRVSNISASDADRGWSDEIWLSDDAAWDAGDTLLHSDWVAEGLAAGAEYVKTRAVTIRQGESGTKYLLVVTNRTAVQGETDTANNIAVKPIALGAPDLAISEPAAPAAASWGQPFEVSWTVANTGDVAAPAAWYDDVYLSADTTWDFSDRILASFSSWDLVPLGPGESYTVTRTATIPSYAGMTGGLYLLFRTDIYGAQNETDETNNIVAVPITVGSPDLEISAASAAPAAVFGQAVDLSWTVSNIGGNATAGTWRDRVYLSGDDQFDCDDLELAAFTAREGDLPLAGGGSYTRTESIELPLRSTLAAGAYYLIVVTDSGGEVAELSEDNNRAATAAVNVALPDLPDLQVSLVTAPAAGHSGQAVELTWTVANSGSGDATGSWSDRVYLSADGAVGADQHIASFAYAGTIASGSSLVRTQTVVLPSDLQGQAWFVVAANANGGLFEHTATDNNAAVAAAPIDVTLHAPNLQVAAVQPPQTASSGQAVTVEYTVTNAGNAATSAPIWYDRVYLSLDAAWHAGDTLLATVPNGSYLNPGDSYANTVTAVVPEGVEGTYYFIVVTDTYNQVTELGHENDNAGAGAATAIELTPPPDLVVASARTIGTAFSGQPVPVQWTVINDGASPTQGSTWTDRLYLSADNQLDPHADLLLGTVNHSGRLLPGQSYAVSTTATLPVDATGQWHLLVLVDAYGSVFEHTYEVNNVHDLPVQVTLTPPPDLEVTAVAAPAEAIAGHGLELTWTVVNRGSTATAASRWADGVYLSADGVFDPEEDLRLGDVDRYGTLAPGQSYTRTASVTLPHDLAGTFTVFVRADRADAVFELDNDNNALAAAAATTVLLRAADLAVTALAVPADARAGQGVYVDWTVANQGAGATTAPYWYDRLVLSADTVLSGNDVVLGTYRHDGALAAGESYGRNDLVVLPATWAGDAYILAVADNHAYVVEVGGEDNNATASTAIAVAQRAVDLVVTSVSAPAAVQSGASLPVAWSVRNNGEGYPVDAWYDRVYLSPDGVLGGEDDILLGSLRHTGGLPAGAQYDASLNASLGADLSGAWYVVVVTDAFGGVAEGDGEDNNATASDEPITVTLTPSPDLVVAAIAAPATVVSGQTAELAWTVANTGDGPAAGSRYDAVYLSRDLVLDTATDSYLGYAWRNTTIPAGSSEQVAGSFRIPAGRSGPYYVFVVADSRGSIAERGGEANNVGYTGSPVQVNVAPPADLVAGQITIPAGVTPGQNVSLTYTVSNGGLNTAVGAWFDALYLSADAVWDVGDRLIGRYQHSGDVAAGGTYTHTLVAPLPGVNPGEYHVLLRSDIRNNVEESSEANNFSASLDRAEIDAERLDLADPAAGTLAQGFSRYYKVDVPAGQTLLVRLDSQAADAANRLFVAFGRVPTASDFDVASAGAFLADVEAVVPTTQAGTYYIMATAELVVGAEQTYDLTAEIVPYSVRQALPAAVGDTGPVTLKLRGARLTADTTFGLVGPDGVVIAPTAVRVVDPSLAYATFDLAGAALGAYAVRATDVGAALNHVLADGVTVIDGAGARIDARFEGPTSVRFGSSYQVGLYYGNLGDADGIAPLIWLANNTGTPMGVTPDGLDDGPGMMFLGAGDEGPAGVLRPGELYTIPIYFHASTETIDYNSVSIYHADDVGAIDWDFFEPGVRRTDMSDELWAAVWRQVQDNIGDTMGSLVRTLAANATLLPASMGSPRHVGLLLQMEVERALAQVTSSLAGTCVRGSLDVQVAGRTLYAIRREGSEVFHAVAMNDGSFYLHGLPAGTYDFAFEGAVVDAADQGQVVAADQHRTGVRLSLIAGSQVGGVVRAAVGGAAIGGATVTLRSPAGLALAVRTDAAGRYRFDGLDAGTYRLTVAAPGRATTTTALEVAARGQSLAADVLLAAESTLRGSLVYAAGPADTLLRVTAVSRTDAGSVFTLETDLAAFELGRLPADTYDVFLSRSGYRSVELEGVAVGSDQSVDLGEIAMDAAAALSGYVTSHVGGVTPGMVDLTLWEDDEIRGHAVPAADGYFYFTDFGPGTYRIEVNEGTTHVSSSITLSVTDGQSVADLVLGVYGGAVVTGVIRDATTSQPVPGMSVTLIGADGEALAAVSDGQGVYRFERLATGTVVVGLAPADEGLRRTLVLDDPDGQEYTADFAYDYASAARVSGVLRDADGQAVAYGRAALFQSGRFVVGAVADELGRYEFVVFQPGSYDLVATAGDVTFASVDGLAVGEGAHVTQDLQGGRGSLSVTVNNLPAGTGAVVALYHRLAGRWSLVHRGGIAAGSPLLTLSGCAAGDYRVQVSTEEGLGGVADASLPTGGAVSAAVNLQPFASLDGIIRHNGQPLAGANVVLAMRDGSGMALTTVTDTRGYYEFPLIDPVASHDLIIVAEGMAARTETMDPLGAGAHGQDFSLTASTSALNGRVVDGADRPIAGAMVSVTDAAGRTIGSALTAADGRFSIATAVGANLTVDVAAPCYRGETLTGAAIPAGTVQDLGDVTLTLVGESRFTGDLALLADDPLPAPPSRDGWVYHSPGKPGWMDALFDEEPRLIYTPLAELEALNPPANCPLAASAKALLIEAWMVQDSSYQWVQENQEVLDALVKAEAGSAVLNGLAFSGRIASIVLNVNALRGAVQAIRLIPAASASQTMFQEVAEHHQAIREAIEGVVQGLTGALSDVQGISSSPTPESALSQFANVMTVVNDCMGLLAGAVSTLATLLKDKAGAALVGGAGAAFGLLNDLIGIKDTLQYGYDAFVEGYHGLQNIVAAKERLTDAKVLYRKNVAAYQSAWSYYLGTLSWCRRDDGDGDDEGDDAPPPPEPPAPPPPPPGHRYYRPGVVRSKDPNDILGPSGRGEENFVWADTAFGYTIRFENSASATAAARTVVITQQLDADLDWRTFRIDDLGWGDFRLELDASMPILARRVDLTDSAGYLVDVTAYIDVLTGVATWRLETIDPATGEPPLDPSVGFLPPNNEDGVGDGFVTYSIRPRSDAPTGTRIDAEATIVFDTEAPLDTPPIFHTLDVDAPASSVQVLTGATGEAHFDVRWSGSDGQGAGIASYDLYVSVDDGPFQPWLIGTTLTEAVYRGLPGHRYAFYSVARDGVDNVEPHALTFDARTYTTTGAVPPTAADDQATVSEDAPAAVIDVLANDTTDPEIGQAFTVTAVTQGAHGTVTVAGDGLSVSYQPAADFYGTDTFTYTITDEDGLTDTATVTVTVANMPDPPTAVDDAATVAEDSPATAIDVLANDTTSPDPNQTVA